jgi:hypothetical protein
MNKHERVDMADWEEQLNELLDGELGPQQAEDLKTAAEQDRLLARAIVESYQLQKALSEIPVQRAPASLRRKLQKIPRQQQALARPWFFRPRWAFAVAAVPALILVLLWPQGVENTPAEVAQGKRDLAVALYYFDKSRRRAVGEIETRIDQELGAPVVRQTARALADQLEIKREYEL